MNDSIRYPFLRFVENIFPAFEFNYPEEYNMDSCGKDHIKFKYTGASNALVYIIAFILIVLGVFTALYSYYFLTIIFGLIFIVFIVNYTAEEHFISIYRNFMVFKGKAYYFCLVTKVFYDSQKLVITFNYTKSITIDELYFSTYANSEKSGQVRLAKLMGLTYRVIKKVRHHAPNAKITILNSKTLQDYLNSLP